MEPVKELTQYFRDSLAVKPILPFKKKPYKTLEEDQLKKGNLGSDFWDGMPKERAMIIVAKTIQCSFLGQRRVSGDEGELAGLFYIPCRLSSKGNLLPPEGDEPWIARDFLLPNIDPDRTVGKLDDMDRFLSEHRAKVMNDQNLTWKKYLNFAARLYEAVVDHRFEDKKAGPFTVEPHIYIIENDQIDTSKQIRELYENLMEREDLPSLYKKFLSAENSIIEINEENTLENMKHHKGQMGGAYPLSTSQRESMNHFTNMEDGEILAVHGPPGTGKTTLIQSLVATLFVERALKKGPPPLIVASSTNNQAVTNIIESFQNMKGSESLLMERWIGDKVNDFATYFPSAMKMDNTGFQITTKEGGHFVQEVEHQEYKRSAEKMFLRKSEEYFQYSNLSVKSAKKQIYEKLLLENKYCHDLLTLFQEYEQKFGQSVGVYQQIRTIDKRIQEIKEEYTRIQARSEEWEEFFKSLPFYWKWFSFLPMFKKRISLRLLQYRNVEETHIAEDSSYEDIMGALTNQLSTLIEEKEEKIKQRNFLREMETQLQDLEQRITDNPSMEINQSREKMNSAASVNELLDTTVKHSMFWLAVHYYEAQWLLEKPLTSKQSGKTYPNIIQHRYKLLSMISPCFVMTFYQLPKNFKAYNPGGSPYLSELIDLLIVDEAGQVTPEVAAASFSLAKRAVVVGDVHQIEPVWNITEELDLTLIRDAFHLNEVHTVKELYSQLLELGLNVSQSSVMKVSAKSTKYEKHDQRGMFLSEHRRCYNEIVGYCNDLVYEGKLEPLRGTRESDEKNQLPGSVPPMGHVETASAQSLKRNGSRYNLLEADAIVTWISENFETIRMSYNQKEVPNEALVGVITPFKQQEIEIKKKLKKRINGAENIEVGTVHKFQGAERKVIILSTVYGGDENPTFMNRNTSMMNVAVSRAKDSFIVIGDRKCLGSRLNTPTGLLNTKLKNIN
ncbi:AAA domain-containing protein [Halobacillus litoralis]|uniref:AAA domain-containing protein n=1 Tax=Halobacillus litoralis TaxID=45668 RepID=UPI001CD45B3E|nr:AAA domain-containing protein [Halobacillus litoralis]MCA1021094.1 AAA family ATPase [Halobacillus litoralis]